jgi:hypothetical protein
MATLHFEGPRTAQRAELICRAAASAAEKNLKGRGGQSLTTSRSGSPGETSDKSLSQGPESASRGMGLNLLIPQSGSGNSQGKSSLSNGTSPSGLGGFGKMPSSNEGQSEYFFAYCFFCTWQSGPGSFEEMSSSRPLLTRDGLPSA